MTKIRSSSDRVFWFSAAALVLFLYFFGLTIPLLGPDEPRYAQVGREMFLRGNWITPTLGGFNWFEKPALLYWLEIASYHAFGVTEFAARFGPAVFGILTAASLWFLGRRVESHLSDDAKPDGGLANWLALILATSLGMIVFARGASFDIVLTFPVTAAMACFFIAELAALRKATARRGRAWPELLGFYFFIGIALLAKGLVGIVFPLAIVAFYFLLSWRLPDRRFIVSLFWGSLVAAGVASVWYLPMYLRHGWEFVDEFFIQHHFQRYTSNKYLHPQPFYFFFWVLPLMTIPWLPFFLAALWKFGRQAIEAKGSAPEREVAFDAVLPGSPGSISGRPALAELVRFAAAWMIVPLAFFSFSGSKLPGYILPALPPAAIITVVYLMDLVRTTRRAAAILKGLAMATVVVVVGIIIFALPRFADLDSVKSLIESADSRGYQRAKVLTMHTISHNAEFYAAGRLVRDSNGRQLRLPGVAEVLNEIKRAGSDGALVLVPIEYRRQLADSPLVDTELISDNGELAIAYVRPK